MPRLSAIAGLLALGAVLASADTLLANGSFEEGKARWWGEGGWSVVQDGAADRAAALRLAGGYVCQDKIAVQGGRRYRLELQVRCDGAPEGSVFVQASFRGPGVDPGWRGPVRAQGEAALLATGGSHGWKPFAVVIDAPAGADQFLVYLRKAPGSAGTAGFDAVTLAETSEAATPVTVDTRIVNGDFEQGKASWWGEGTWSVEAGRGVDAGAALQVGKGFACQDKIAVAPRRNYRITVQVRSAGCAADAVYAQASFRGQAVDGGWRGPAQVKLKWGTEAALFTSGGDHDWKTCSAVVAAPAGAQQLLVYLRKQDGPGTAWFDRVAIEPTDEQPLTAADVRRAALAAELLAPPAADAAPALAAAVAAATGPGRELALGAGGARIHVGAAADAVVLGAARELARCLKDITGADRLPLSHDGAPASGPLLVVGRDSPIARAVCGDVDWAALGEDGFVIRSRGTHLVLAGAGDRGTQYAVNWFLDRELGMRWLAPGCTRMPSTPDLRIPALDLRQVPSFAYREVLSYEGSDAPFAAHNLLNGRSHGPSFSPTAPEIDTWDHQWMAKGGSANFHELLKPYAKDHPEWFAGGQVAMMDKGMRAAMAKEVIARLQAHPDYTRIWYNIWQMDWGWDLDPASKAFAEAHGGRASAPRLDMMIDIGEQVRAALPGARLAMQAYTWGFAPPPGMTVPDWLLVFPMTLHVDYKTPLNAGRNQRLGADIVQWTRLAKNAQVWDHIANWAGFIQPTPNIYPIGDSIRWLATVPGVHGYFCEGDWNSAGGEFGALRAWLIARLTWDAGQDPKALVAEWCRGYYDAAAPQVIAYIDLMHAIAAKTDDVLGQRYMPDLPMYDLAFIAAADALFDQAEAAVSGDAGALGHVRQARMGVDYLALLRRNEYAAAAAAQGSPWKPDTAARRARFDRALVDNRVTEYRQGGGVKELAALLDVERCAPAPDPLAEDLPAADRADIQDLAFMRFDTAAILQDAAASDHAAIRMSGKSSTWAMQLPFGALPKQGEWDLYAAVRVEAEPGHDDEPAVRVGSAPPMGLFNTATAKQLGDGAYHLVKVPGGPHHWEPNNPLKSVYIQSPAKPWLTWVWLDRIVAVRRKG